MTKIETHFLAGAEESAALTGKRRGPAIAAPAKRRRKRLAFRATPADAPAQSPEPIDAPRATAAAETAPAGARALREPLRRLLARLRVWRLARREARLFALTVRELDDLSDDVLKDIGLVRGSIKATLRERGRG